MCGLDDRSNLGHCAIAEADVSDRYDHGLFVDCVHHGFNVDGEVCVSRDVYYFGATALLGVPDLTDRRKFVVGSNNFVATFSKVERRSHGTHARRG